MASAARKKPANGSLLAQFDIDTKNMALGFLTNKEAREQISGLGNRVSELELEISTAGESLASAQNELATARESLAEAQGDLANAKERIADLETENAKIPDLEAAAKLTAERVSIEASRQLAASGHPAPIEGIEDKETQNTITRAQFNALSQRKRTEHIRNGGKLTD